jgi:hypothetical protein
MVLTHDQVLALLTADPDTWELAELPEWLADECRGLGLIGQQSGGIWRLTPAGYRERQSRLGIDLLELPHSRPD